MNDVRSTESEEQPGGAGGSGRCVCGAVRYVVTGALRPVVNCHCHRCRRFTGHHMAASSARVADIELEGDDTLTWFEAANGVFYGFCSTCGSSLFWKNDEEPERLSICAGTLDPPTGLRTTTTLWMSEISDYHTSPTGLVERRFDT